MLIQFTLGTSVRALEDAAGSKSHSAASFWSREGAGHHTAYSHRYDSQALLLLLCFDNFDIIIIAFVTAVVGTGRQ